MKAAGHSKNITLHSVHRYLLCFIYYLCSSEKQFFNKRTQREHISCTVLKPCKLGLILRSLVRLKTSEELRIKFSARAQNFYNLLRIATEKPCQNKAAVWGYILPQAQIQNNHREPDGVISDLHHCQIQVCPGLSAMQWSTNSAFSSACKRTSPFFGRTT